MSVSADKNQRRIFLALPFVFIPFILNFPAGLLVYWITTNLWTIVQQFIVRKTVGPVVKPGDAAAATTSSDDDGQGRRRAAQGARRRAAAARPRAAVAASGSGGAPRRTTAPAAPAVEAQEEALGTEAIDGRRAAPAARRCASCSSGSSSALDLEADVEIVEDDERADRHAQRRRPRAVHRPPRPDDRGRPAPRPARRRRAATGRAAPPRRRRRRRLPRAPRAASSSARPRRRRTSAAQPAAPSRSTP